MKKDKQKFYKSIFRGITIPPEGLACVPNEHLPKYTSQIRSKTLIERFFSWPWKPWEPTLSEQLPFIIQTHTFQLIMHPDWVDDIVKQIQETK